MQDYPHHYEVTATAAAHGSVTVTSAGLPDLETQSPPQFGGPEGVWSPETLLTAAVADCFILSFRSIARASKFDWISLDCETEGVLDRVERKTQFTGFNIRAELHVPEDSRKELAQRLLEKAEEICLITASLKAPTTLQTEIHVD